MTRIRNQRSEYGYEEFHESPIRGRVDPNGKFTHCREHGTFLMEEFPEYTDAVQEMGEIDWGDVPDAVVELAFDDGWIATGPQEIRLGHPKKVTARQMMALRGLFHDRDEIVEIETSVWNNSVRARSIADAMKFSDLRLKKEPRKAAETREFAEAAWARKAAGERGIEENPRNFHSAQTLRTWASKHYSALTKLTGKDLEAVKREADFYNDQYASGEPGSGAAADFDWYVGYVPFSVLGDRRSWASWMREELNDPDAKRIWGWLLYRRQDEEDPIIVVEDADEVGDASLWDGNHRTGAAAIAGRKCVFAFVGLRKRRV